METAGGGGLQPPEERKLQRQQKGKLTKQEVGGGFADPSQSWGGVEDTCKTHTTTQIVHSIRTWKLVFPVCAPERLSGVSWKHSELRLMKLHGVHNPRWLLHLTTDQSSLDATRVSSLVLTS